MNNNNLIKFNILCVLRKENIKTDTGQQPLGNATKAIDRPCVHRLLVANRQM